MGDFQRTRIHVTEPEPTLDAFILNCILLGGKVNKQPDTGYYIVFPKCSLWVHHTNIVMYLDRMWKSYSSRLYVLNKLQERI